jgi:hypothetical protein
VELPVRAGFKALVEHMGREGFATRFGADCAYLGFDDVALVVTRSQYEPRPGGRLFMANLSVALRIYAGRQALFQDTVSALGASRDEAAINALLNVWRPGTLPPILPLLGAAMPPEVTVIGTDDPLYCAPWVAYCGPCLVLSGQQDTFLAAVRSRPPFLALRKELAALPHRTAMHWLTLSRSRDPQTGSDETTCLVDGRLHTAAGELLSKWQWPAVSCQQQFRQFVVLLPEESA